MGLLILYALVYIFPFAVFPMGADLVNSYMAQHGMNIEGRLVLSKKCLVVLDIRTIAFHCLHP